jgi:lipid-binding SYLF domain-containing protein
MVKEDVMFYYLKASFVVLISMFLVSCATAKGVTKQDQRVYALNMKNETLAQLYKEKPETRAMVKKAAGYGVFSNIGSYLFFLSTGGGYGVVVDNSTGEQTYMKMAHVGAGLGIGIKDFKVVFIFKNKKVLNDFIEKGWEFGAQADAAVKSGEKGMAAGGEVYIESDIIIYQITEAGVALQATVGGTKYWKDKKLN